MTIGDRIKETRTRLKLSQVDFASEINVSKQTLYKYENNIITNIPSDKIEAVARLGHISPAYLMGWEKSPAASDPLPSDQQQLNDIYTQLNSSNKKKSLTYSRNLLSTQQMEDDVLAAHARTDVEQTPEGVQHDIDIMNDDSLWE